MLLTFGFLFVAKQFPDFPFWKYSFVSFVIFTFLYSLNFLYERYFWNHGWFKKIFVLIGFQEYPDIVGKWEMEYSSSYKYDWEKSEYKTKGAGDVVIKKIEGGFHYSGHFDKSSFGSSSNYFENNRNNKNEWILGYKYNNNPKETVINDLGFVGHFGFSMLTFDSENPNKMTGFYGNDENRKTRGKIVLKRES